MLQQQLDRYLGYLAQDRENINLLLNISDAYRVLNDFERSKHYLDQAKEYINQPEDLAFHEARLLHHVGELDQAILLLEQSIKNPETLGLLALLHFDNNSIEKAELTSNEALTLQPTQSNGLLVQLLIKALNHEVTIHEVQDLLESQPNESRLWYVLGTTQLNQLNCLAAEEAFLKATNIHPEFYDCWICLGWCYLLQDNLNAAEAIYQNALNLDPEQAEGYAGLAIVNILQNKITEGESYLKQAENIDPNNFYVDFARKLIFDSDRMPCFNR